MSAPRRPLRLAVLVLLALRLDGCSGGASSPGVLLIIVDTLRADRVGCYGNAHARTPHLDRMARAGIQFETALSHVPVTAPAVTTILTGTYPPFHGIRDNGRFTLRESATTAAEVFLRNGYRTAAFVGASVLDARYGLAQGFETYDDDVSAPYSFHRADLRPTESSHQDVERRAEETTRRAAAWLRDHASERFFLVVHYFDPHDPYDPPPEWVHPSLETLYDAEIAATDRSFGKLLGVLEAEGLAGRTLLAVTADHGEGAGDHGEITHGFFLYDSTMRVPLLFRGPGLPPTRRVISRPARLVDVAPTLTDLCGLAGPGPGQGESLGPVLGGVVSGPPEPAYLENFRVRYSYGWSELTGLRTGGWKYIRAPRPELYDLESDPGELVNLYDADPERARSLSAQLDGLLGRTVATPTNAEPLAIDEKSRRRLEALGYVDSPGAPPDRDGGDLPDPKDEVAAFLDRQKAKDQVLRARALADRGRISKAEAVLREAIRLSPDLVPAHFSLGMVLGGQGKWEEARRALREAVELDPHLGEGWTALGFLAYGRGDDAVARECFETAQARAGDAWTRFHLLSFYLRTARREEALHFLDTLRRQRPGDSWPALATGLVHAVFGRFDAEAEHFRSVLDAGEPTAKLRLSELEVHRLAPEAFRALREGDFERAVPLLEQARATHAASPPLARALARALAESGRDPARAETLLRPVPGENPVERGLRLAALGRVQLLRGRAGEAKRTLAQASDALTGVFEPYLASLRFHQGLVAAALGDDEQARAFLSRSLDTSFGAFWEGEALQLGGERTLARHPEP